MKHTKRIICLALGVILLLAAICLSPTVQLHLTMFRYSTLVGGGIPDDFTLTIYYMDPSILTRYPYDAKALKRVVTNWKGDEAGIIEVDSLELSEHVELLRKLDASVLHPVEEKGYLNARLCYVFEASGEAVLEVAMHSGYGNAFVNGLEVENNQVFLDVVAPFLPEEMYNKFVKKWGKK